VELLREIEKERKDDTALWCLGGPTIGIHTRGTIIYIDPFFGPSTNPQWTRRFDSLIEPTQIRKADYILITHEHRDHCNGTTMMALEENVRPEYFLPASSLELVSQEYEIYLDPKRLHIVKPGDQFSIAKARLMIFASADQTAKEAASYFIITQDGNIFHAGDSLYVPSYFQALEPYGVDIALLALGENPEGWNVYPTRKDFTKLAREIGAKLTVPIHWDLWKESYVDAHAVEKKFKETEVRVIPRGGKISLPLEN